ncbi:hypothetical protein CSB45_10300 [candidate division KSB3 bacterium]|uniref:Heme exporter protein C n=1 Tax=candidate division KSB3 bacterium TaxID=2044937 RepID=A0A2G6E3H2_9BACT|nr:MAG: hypothetical protein CSB45_10300 [candidate division KSB3 bacterium]PIE29195.1 MAG: hypothetical protein CSA57_10325 [candidate division KSB3 bacterium]
MNAFKKMCASSILCWLSSLTMTVTLYMVFWYAADELEGSGIPRIFYFYFSFISLAVLSFFLFIPASLGYLILKKNGWDLFAETSAELGLLFSSLLMLGMPFLTKSVRGAWWILDGRFMLIAALWLVYAGYFLVRRAATDSHKAAQTAAVFGSLCLPAAPVSVILLGWWQTLFPAQQLIIPARGRGVTAEEMATLQVSLVTFLCLFAYLFQQRFVIAYMQREVDRIRRSIADRPVQHGFLVENRNYVIDEYNFREYRKDE